MQFNFLAEYLPHHGSDVTNESGLDDFDTPAQVEVVSLIPLTHKDIQVNQDIRSLIVFDSEVEFGELFD